MSSSPRGKTLLDTMLLTLSAAALSLSWFLFRKSGRRGALAVTAPALSFSPGTPRWFSPVPGITSLRPDLTTVPLGFYDVALRDFGLLVAALTLGRLAAVYDPPWGRHTA
jgi:hypothetical protein